MNRKVAVNTAQPGDEMVLESADSALCGITSVYVRWHQLIIDVLLVHEGLEDLGAAFIVEAL
jgi:hypothetical protein